MTYVVVPNFDATLADRIPLIAITWFFLHWIYGAFTGLFLPVVRRAFRPTARVQTVESRQAAA